MVLGSYKNSKKNLYLSLLLEFIIAGIIIITLSYGLSYFTLYEIYHYNIGKINVRFMVPLKYIVIFFMIYFVSIFASLYFVSVKQKKEEKAF